MSARLQKKRDRDRCGKEGVEGGFQALIPVAVGDGEAEVEQLGQDDTVLIVRIFYGGRDVAALLDDEGGDLT